jgi:hypothetical protein
MIRMVYTCMSVLLASAPMLPVYAGKQSTPESPSTTGGSTPSTNNPGQGGTQNTPNTPNTPNTNTATPPQVVNQLAQQAINVKDALGVGGAIGVGALGLGGLAYAIAVKKGKVRSPKKMYHDWKNKAPKEKLP